MNDKRRFGKFSIVKIWQFMLLFVLVVLAIWLVNRVGSETVRANVNRLGLWAYLLVFGLRLISIIIPAIPGTAYSVLAGGLFGLLPGLIVICLADLVSCTISFYLARRYGRNLVRRLVGTRFISRVDGFSQKHLEQNFFLTTGLLMTGFFDFVCYGVGLTKAPWRRFFLSLVISIAISNPPIVALGAGILERGKLVLGFAILGIFLLAIVTALVRRQQPKQTREK